MYILAPSSDTPQYTEIARTVVKSIQYAARKWYEITGDIQSYVEACKCAEAYYKHFAAIGGIPLVIEGQYGYGIFVDAAGFQETESIEQHARSVYFPSLRPASTKRYALKERAQFHYPLASRR